MNKRACKKPEGLDPSKEGLVSMGEVKDADFWEVGISLVQGTLAIRSSLFAKFGQKLSLV